MEFAEQARQYASDLYPDAIDIPEWGKAYHKKFAELIVQECLLAISKTPNLFTEEEVAVMVKCHDHVEEHFGVKS
jgi:hypothetical protein